MKPINSILLSLSLALGLSGCTLIPKPADKPSTPQQYTLSPPADQAATAAQKPDNQGETMATLRIENIDLPQWLNTTSIYYRLDYEESPGITPYSRARWASSPAILVGDLIQMTLANGAQWRAVVGAASLVEADYILRLRMTDFQQVFTSRKESFALLRAVATLIDNASGNIVAQREFRFKTPAPSADAEGGTRALSKDTYKLAQALSRWLQRDIDIRKGGT